MYKFRNRYFLVVCLLIGCKTTDKYTLEKEPMIDVEKAYFTNWSSGVKGGKRGINIYVYIKKNLPKTLSIKGVYFSNGYSKLTKQNSTTYKGFISKGKNSKEFQEVFRDSSRNQNKRVKYKEIPFSIEDNEAVISILKRGKLKYQKITVVKKTTMNVPM